MDVSMATRLFSARSWLSVGTTPRYIRRRVALSDLPLPPPATRPPTCSLRCPCERYNAAVEERRGLGLGVALPTLPDAMVARGLCSLRSAPRQAVRDARRQAEGIALSVRASVSAVRALRTTQRRSTFRTCRASSLRVSLRPSKNTHRGLGVRTCCAPAVHLFLAKRAVNASHERHLGRGLHLGRCRDAAVAESTDGISACDQPNWALFGNPGVVRSPGAPALRLGTPSRCRRDPGCRGPLSPARPRAVQRPRHLSRAR